MASWFEKDVGKGAQTLLRLGDPDPVALSNPGGASSFLLVGDHAGVLCPAALGDLGVAPPDWARHIACDIGTRALGEALAERLDARFVHQCYSRLVIDCNRDPAHPDAIVTASDGTPVPGNLGIDEAGWRARVEAIHAPYQAAIAAELARPGDVRCVLVSLHSFTPVWQGQTRPWPCGVLHGSGDDRFALGVLARLADAIGPNVGDNQPYRLDATDYTVPRHAIGPGLPYVELEIRQDLLASRDQVAGWVDHLAPILVEAARDLAQVA